MYRDPRMRARSPREVAMHRRPTERLAIRAATPPCLFPHRHSGATPCPTIHLTMRSTTITPRRPPTGTAAAFWVRRWRSAQPAPARPGGRRSRSMRPVRSRPAPRRRRFPRRSRCSNRRIAIGPERSRSMLCGPARRAIPRKWSRSSTGRASTVTACVRAEWATTGRR
ncbi:hypothetical protein [Lysobacter gummosus]|uniref:hypothetical protein n=1 Tax=Lysobacter gummosus TaxID=262324 RepID=UPI003629F3CD